MERSGSTIDKNSLKFNTDEGFLSLRPLKIKDLKVLIFCKTNALKLSPYIQNVIEYLQKFNIRCFVTEEVLKLLETDFAICPRGSADDETVGSSNCGCIDIEKIEVLQDENVNIINRVITLGGDGTVVQAIKLFHKDKCPKMITFSEESLGYLCCFENEKYEEVLYHSLIQIADDADEYDIKHEETPE